jgi:DNA-binding PadR family transcriptional regulator
MRRVATLTLSPLDLRVLVVLRDDPRRWLTTDQVAAQLEYEASARDRTRILAALSWMVRGQLIARHRRDLGERTVYALTTRGERELKDRAQMRLAA